MFSLSRLNPGNIKMLHKGLILVFMPLLYGLIFFGVLIFLVDQSDRAVRRQILAREVETRIATFSQMFFEANTIMLAYPFTRQQSLVKRYDRIREKSKENFDTLKAMLRDDPELSKRLDHLQMIEDRSFKLLDELRKEGVEIIDTIEFVSVRGVREQMQSLLRQFVAELTDFRNTHRRDQKGFKPDAPEYAESLRLLALAGVIAAIPIALILVEFLGRGITRRLDTVMDNASRLASSRPLTSPVEGSDEIARLDRVFRGMARALEETKRRERAIVDNALDVICSLDQDNRFTEVSPAALKVWGYAPDEIVGTKLLELVAREDGRDMLTAQQRLGGGRLSATIENRVQKRDGNMADMLWSIRWLPDQKKYFCVAHDITERKTAEDQLEENEGRIRTIVESMPISLFICNPEGSVETSNLRSEEMFGYSYEEIAGKRLQTLFRGFERASDEDFMQLLEEKWLGRVTEIDGLKQDGSEFPVEISITTFEDRDSFRLLVIALDVTERHEVETWKREFIQMVSHDLRTPLSSVQGTLSMFSTGMYGEFNEKGIETVERCQTELERLMVLIDELLDLEKFQAGKMKMEFERIDLSSVVERSVAAVSYIADKNGIAIDVRPNPLKVEELADGPKLVQVIVNLLSNAIKFSPSGSTVTVAFQQTPEGVEFSVSDQGRGIPASHLDKIFERFKQVETADHRDKGGKGLGLAICKSIVEAHGGRIWVESEEGRGSTFRFVIRV